MDLKFVNIETFVIQFILLFAILYVLNKYVWKPYLEYLDNWEQKQEKLEAEYENIDKLIADAEVKREQILKKARKKWDTIVSDSEAMGKKKWEEIVAKAEVEARGIMDNAEIEIEKERLSTMNEIKDNVVDLILKMSSKLFKEEKYSKEYLEKELESLNK